ncbi:MAG: biotin/lipoate A/B protein ligase family protein [bacterium]
MSARPALWLDTGHAPDLNMARDAALLDACEAGRVGVVLRLFRFSPPGITLGRAQVPERELDLARVSADGVPWAVRPTGGRAIWHDEEWTFSLVTPLSSTGWAERPELAYARTGRLLADALQRLGVPATLAPGSPRGVGAPRASVGAAPPCFASTARHELVVEGRKLAGIAQRVRRETLLQQGSLLVGGSHVRLADYVAVPDGARDDLRRAMRAGSADAGAWLGEDRSLSRLGEAIAACWPEAERWSGDEGARHLA